MKRVVAITMLALIAATAWFWRRQAPAPPMPVQSELPAPAFDLRAEAVASVRRAHELANNFLTATKDPYRPPLGDNEDLVRALRGGNRYGDVWLRDDDPMLNERGQLVDPWGTPLHIHPRALDAIDIRSAGPDRVLFTEDDVVIGARALFESDRAQTPGGTGDSI